MRKFLRMSLLSFKAMFGWLDPKAYILTKIIDPCLQMIFYSLLVRFTFGSSDITPWIIGNAFLLSTRNAVFATGSLLRNERFEGTLKLVIVSPGNKLLTFVARSFISIFDAAVTVVVGLLVGTTIFHVDLSGINYFQFVLSILTAMFGGTSLGLVIATAALVMREIHLFLNVAAMMLFILTGASFPIERLPALARTLSYFLPITRSIEASRTIAAKGSIDKIYTLLGTEIIISIVYLFFAYFLYMYFEKKARIEASLDVY
jgi:ABC-2 type transport system permease protein